MSSLLLSCDLLQTFARRLTKLALLQFKTLCVILKPKGDVGVLMRTVPLCVPTVLSAPASVRKIAVNQSEAYHAALCSIMQHCVY